MVTSNIAIVLLIIAVFALGYSTLSLQYQINEINDELLVLFRTVRLLIQKVGKQ